jgi:hypothetical protein
MKKVMELKFISGKTTAYLSLFFERQLLISAYSIVRLIGLPDDDSLSLGSTVLRLIGLPDDDSLSLGSTYLMNG